MTNEETSEIFTRFLTAAPDPMLIVDSDGILFQVNTQLEELFGYGKDELLGKPIEILVPDTIKTEHTALRNSFNLAPRTRLMGESVELKARRKDGSEFPLTISLSPLKTSDGLLVIAAIHDLTARKAKEKEQREQEIQLQHGQKLESLGVLAGGIAHDFNNLLTSILGHAGLALKHAPTESALRSSILEIEQTAERAAELIMQMLAYSGKGHFTIQPLNLSTIVEEMSHLLQTAISKKAVIRYDFFADLPDINGDATQIRQVVMNLITNASDAIGERSGIITLRTGMLRVDKKYLMTTEIFDELAEGSYAYLEVSDTGTGMDAATQAKIFDPFFTTKFTGRGLGLAAVMGIVRGHKAAIKLYSEVERGTTFKVLFPCSDVARPAKDDAFDQIKDWKGKGKILIVDDEESIRGFLCSMLQSIGFEVLEAEDGRKALTVFEENAEDISLVLLDLTMPHLGGEETFMELRRIRDDVPVVLMSGYTEEEVTSLFAGKGIAGFLQKPFRIDTLHEILHTTLDP